MITNCWLSGRYHHWSEGDLRSQPGLQRKLEVCALWQNQCSEGELNSVCSVLHAPFAVNILWVIDPGHKLWQHPGSWEVEVPCPTPASTPLASVWCHEKALTGNQVPTGGWPWANCLTSLGLCLSPFRMEKVFLPPHLHLFTARLRLGFLLLFSPGVIFSSIPTLISSFPSHIPL